MQPIQLVRMASLAVAAVFLSAAFAQAQESQPTNLNAAGGMNELVAKAKKEGALLVYGAPSQDKMEKWFAGFTKKYGIPVQYYRAPTNPLMQRFSQEQTVGKNMADAITISDRTVLMAADSKGWISEYTPSNANAFPADAVVPGKAYPLYLTISAVGWNTRVVPQDLQKKLFADPLGGLLDPRLKGKISAVTVTAGGPQIASNSNIALNLSDKYGWKYFESLSKQAPVIVNSTTTALRGIIAGDYWATLDGYSSVFAPKVVDGAPIAFQSPDTASAAEFYLSVVAHAPHPYAARLFQEWAMTPEAQDSLAVFTQGDVTVAGWTDNRAIRKESWYRPAKHLWFGWATDPQLKGAQLKAFYAKWQSILGK